MSSTGGEVFHVKRTNHQVRTRLLGPRNTFRADGSQTAADLTYWQRVWQAHKRKKAAGPARNPNQSSNQGV